MRALGALTFRLGVCPGDRLYWPKSAGRFIPFRGPAEGFGAAVADCIDSHWITDLVCLGDGRAYHRAAIAAARRRGVTIWIIEHGYLRPGWITIEPDGTGGRSHLPQAYRTRQRDWLQSGESTPDPGARHAGAGFATYAALDIAYHAANFLAPVTYPGYRHHALDTPLEEWRGWIGKALRLPARHRAKRRALGEIQAHDGPVFVFPLQLETDYQIRDHAAHSVAETLRRVMDSFRATAPENARLIVKTHPLDNGLIRWDRIVAAGAQDGRVTFLDGGNLEALIARARGVVTINSTVGLTALLQGCPVKVLGRAVYDLPRLSHPGDLASFWAAPMPPDASEIMAFEAFLKRSIQVPGTFDGPGAAIGAANVAAHILRQNPAPAAASAPRRAKAVDDAAAIA